MNSSERFLISVTALLRYGLSVCISQNAIAPSFPASRYLAPRPRTAWNHLSLGGQDAPRSGDAIIGQRKSWREAVAAGVVVVELASRGLRLLHDATWCGWDAD